MNTIRVLVVSLLCSLITLSAASQEEQKLTASDPNFFDGFGSAVSISGDVALVGASLSDDIVSQSGAAYIYRRVAGVWLEEQKLTASDAAPQDYFGKSVSVSGAVALVGAPSDWAPWPHSGSAYVFRNVAGVWTEQQKLTASDGSESDEFGTSVSIDADVALIGAFQDGDKLS